jgi:hypothetical protein
LEVDSDEKHRGVVTAFSNALRASGLAPMIDLQPAMVFFGRMLQEQPRGVPIDLAKVEEYLLSARAPQKSVDETLLALKARESRLGVRFALPEALEAMPQADRDAVTAELQQRQQGVRGMSAPSGRSSSQVQQAAVPRVDLDDEPRSSSNVREAIASAGDHLRDAHMTLGKKKRLVLALAGTALVVIGVHVYDHFHPVPAVQHDVAFPIDAETLPCTAVKAATKTLFCSMPVAAYVEMANDVRAARGAATKRKAQAAGYATVLVITNEDGRTRDAF